MTRRSLWLVAMLGSAVFAYAWAGAPITKGSAGDGTTAQTRTQIQVQTQSQERATVQTRTNVRQPADGEVSLVEAALAGDAKHDRIHLRLQDGSCLEEAALETPPADLLLDRTRDRLQDGSCLPDGTCVEHDFDYDHGFDYDVDYGYDFLHDGPPPDGGYGSGSS